MRETIMRPEMIEKLKDLQRKTNKSKVKFNGDFYLELEKLMIDIEVAVKKYIIPNFSIEYTIFSKDSMKIKTKDSEKLITCNFTYKKNDEKFGYIDPQFLCSEISKKTRVYDLWKFPILDREKIVNSFVKKLAFIINEY